MFLTYTVISTIQKVETSFNFVWRVARPAQPRAPLRRIPERHDRGAHSVGASRSDCCSACTAPRAWLDSIAHRLDPALGQLFLRIVTIVFASCSLHPEHPRRVRRLIGGVTAGVVWALVGKSSPRHRLFLAVVAVYTGFRDRADHADLGVLELAHSADRRELAFYVQFPQYLPHGREPLRSTAASRTVGLSVMY